jgi:hypothetical protein
VRASRCDGVLIERIPRLEPLDEVNGKIAISGSKRRSNHCSDLACVVGRPVRAWSLLDLAQYCSGLDGSVIGER